MFLRKPLVSALCFVSFFGSQLALAKMTATAAPATQQNTPKSAVLNGVWLGTLHAGAQTLRLRLVIKSDETGQKVYTLYSLDQSAAPPMSCTNVELNGKSLSFDVPAVKGNWVGRVSADRKTLTGTWTQGGDSIPLELTKQAGQ